MPYIAGRRLCYTMGWLFQGKAWRSGTICWGGGQAWSWDGSLGSLGARPGVPTMTLFLGLCSTSGQSTKTVPGLVEG
jgi:hypothetical protein